MRKLNEIKGNKEKDRNTYKVRIQKDELDIINNNRRLQNEAISRGLDPNEVKSVWFKDKETSFNVTNLNFNSKEKNDFRDTLIADLKKYSPKFPELKRTANKDAKLLVIDPADVHIGKLADSFETGKSYNSQIAVNRVKEGVKGILGECSGFKIDKILFVGGNDILHTDTPKRTTTSGTPQDTDGMWYRNFLMAKDLYIDVLETLLSVADVHFVFNPSNHDYTNGFFLANVIETYFKDCKNITFDCSIAHRKYFRYGNNIIGTTHGDGAKHDKLPLLMAAETKYYSECTKRYIYIHHIHHKMSKDYPGVTIESLRSPSEADSWHHRNGYEHSPVALEAFIHHKKHGQTTRLTHYF
jgi:hypothetical protein